METTVIGFNPYLWRSFNVTTIVRAFIIIILLIP